MTTSVGHNVIIKQYNPIDLRRRSQATVDRVVEFLTANAQKVPTTTEIAQVATISANGDTHVGNSCPSHGKGWQGGCHHRQGGSYN